MKTQAELVHGKAEQFRILRDQILRKRPLGKIAVDLLQTQAPLLAREVFQDTETLSLTVNLLRPWIRKPTNADILESEVDALTVENFSRLAERLIDKIPSLRTRIEFLKTTVESAKGKRVVQLLRTPVHPNRAGTQKRARRPKKS